MADLIEEFCAYYHDYNHITQQRRVMQRRILREWEAFVDGPVAGATAEQLEDYLRIQIATLDPKTVGGRLYALRPFFDWLWRRKLISGDRLMELRDVEPPRGANFEGAPNPYSRKEIRQFWIDLDAHYPLDPRWEYWLARFMRGQSPWRRVQKSAKRIQLEAIVALALGGALRRNEIWNIGLDELEPMAEYVTVRKTARKNPDGVSKARAVPWTSEWMHAAIVRWLDLRTRLAPECDQVWLSLHGQWRLHRMSHRQFCRLLSQIGPGYELQRFRHTAATELLRSRHYQLHEVQKILGHARPDQTLRYAQLLPEDIVQAARRGSADYGRIVGPPEAEAA